MTTTSDPLRAAVANLLDSGDAHITFDAAVKDFPAALRGRRPDGGPHSPWELLEHLRIAQVDILEYTRDGRSSGLEFPSGYWPASAEPPSEAAWDASIDGFRRDRAALVDLARDAARDLNARLPHGKATLLEQLFLAADHNAYHLGQLMMVRRLLGA
jgi:hypothetical protein